RRLRPRLRPERVVLRVDCRGPSRARRPRAVIPQRFGQGPPPLTLGVEEELVILDGTTLDQVGRVDEIVGPLEQEELPGRAKTELHASVFELNTNPCATAAEVLD